MKRFIGNREFYKYVFALVVPIIIQQGITSFVNLLDNIMVGALGTDAISAVSISNQILFIHNLGIFGGLGAVAIFGAQFFGNSDMEGMRYSLRAKLIFSVGLSAVTLVLLSFCGDFFIGLFLQGESEVGNPIVTAQLAHRYMMIAFIGILPFAFSQSLAGTLRETGQTVVPMAASVSAILTNLLFNWLLIYGHLGFPKWGVAGASVATALSRYVELIILVVYVLRHTDKELAFMKGAVRSLYIPADLAKNMIRTGFPLFMNEFLWSFGVTVITQSYSTYGLEVVAAMSIAITAWNIAMIFLIAMGSAIQIIVGQHLGMGEIEEAKAIDTRLIALSFVLNSGVAVILIAISSVVPLMFNVEDTVRKLATAMLILDGAVLPIEAIVHGTYFTIRSGGKTLITFLFDSVFTWVVPVPLVFFLCRYSSVSILWVYALERFASVVKMVIGLLMIRSGFWAKKIV